MPSEFFASCTYEECGRIVPGHGCSMNFRGENVIIHTTQAISTTNPARRMSSVKLYGVHEDETVPQRADQDIIHILQAWDEAGRFSSSPT